MENPTLHAFLKAKGLIQEPIKVDKKKVIAPTEPIISNNLITLNKIIETKPSRKTVIKYFQTRMDEREKAELD